MWLIENYKAPDICKYSGKIIYRTKKKAQKYANRYTGRYDKRQYVYKCGKCNYWHLASTPQDNFKG